MLAVGGAAALLREREVPPSKTGSSAAAPTESARVARVVDGDTVRLESGDDVRLVGIDCPERGEPFHDEAKSLAARLLEGRPVTLEFDEERLDRYGRLLAYVFAGDDPAAREFANEALVRAGLAWCYEVAPNTRHRDRLRAAQDEARRERRGVWADGTAGAEGEVIASASGRFHRPSCASVASIKAPVRHPSRSAALDAGLAPCRQCKP